MKTFFARLKNISRIPTRMMLAVVVVGAFAGGSWVFAQVVDVSVQACVKKDGVTRILIPGFTRSECLKDERLVEWNILGPQGEKGDTGEQGVQGQQGVQGLTGPTGATGLQGSVGLSGSNGTNGQNLVVKDANGNRIGILLGINPERWNGNELVPFSWNIWVDAIGATATYRLPGEASMLRPTFLGTDRIYYSGDSCTGSAYTRAYWPGVIMMGRSTSYIYKTGEYTNASIRSYSSSYCESFVGNVGGVYELTEVDAHLSGPLTVARE